MKNELKELLRSVLKEELLEPINKRLDVIEKDVKVIKTGQEQLQKNIIESLGQYTEKIADHVDNKTAALNKRVYDVETEIQRLTRQ